MLSKYILASTWTPLENNYSFDNTITLNNRYFSIVGNIPIVYTPFLNNLKDYSNNNYSLFFLSNKNNLNNFIEYKKPKTDDNRQTFLIATNLVNGLVSDKTLFLSLCNDTFTFVTISNISKYSFFTYDFLSPYEVLVYNYSDLTYTFFIVDDFSNTIKIVKRKDINDLSFSDINFLKNNYLLNDTNNLLVLYKTINDTNFTYKINNLNLLDVEEKSVQSLNSDNLFYVIDYSNLPVIETNIDWISYLRTLNQNNIEINESRSIYNLKNNFLFHSEYNTINNKNIFSNVLTLKNQLNLKDNQTRTLTSNDNREYVSVFTGGDRELGFQKINLGYTSKNIQYNFLPDKTTWFHLPNNKFSPPYNINESNFVVNGAIAGSSPIYSDKIWKKSANYASTSNMGYSDKREHTGQWLCAWLSAGPEKSIWVDRFYNPDTFTPFQALKYTSNIDYTPQYKNKYAPGIVDVPSSLTLENGSWYAYSHIGKKTASNILKGFDNNFISNGLSLYNNSENASYFYKIDDDGDIVYNFNGNEYGALSIGDGTKTYSNFTLSFFATRDNWNKKENYQIMGNYLNSGIGIFNDNSITPNIYYYNDNILKIFNREIKEIQEIDVSKYISLPKYFVLGSNPNTFEEIDNSNILGIWYRGLTENFHVVTSMGYVLEFTANGTIVDTLSTITNNNPVVFNGISVSNNEKHGVVLFNDLRYVKLDLTTNIYTTNFIDTPNTILVNFENILEIQDVSLDDRNYSIIIDPYDKVYIIYGQNAILKGINIYFKDIRSLSIFVYNTITGKINLYIDESKGFVDPINDTNLELPIKKPEFITTGVRSISSFYIFLGYPEENKFDYLKYSLIDKKFTLSGSYFSNMIPINVRPVSTSKFGFSLNLLYKEQVNNKTNTLAYDILYVGAPFDTNGSILSAGSVFCFKIEENFKNNTLNITFLDKLSADNPQTNDQFGYRILSNICDAIYDNGPDSFNNFVKLGLLVSAPNALYSSVRCGKVYLYKKFVDLRYPNFNFGNNTFQTLLPPDPQEQERFGENINIDSYQYSPFTTVFRKRSFTDAIVTCFVISPYKNITTYNTFTSSFSTYQNAGAIYAFVPAPSTYLDNQYLSAFNQDDIKLNFNKLLNVSLQFSGNFYPLVNNFSVSSWDKNTNSFYYDNVVLSAVDAKNIYENRLLGKNFYALNNYNSKSITTSNNPKSGFYYTDLKLNPFIPTTNLGTEIFFTYIKSINLAITSFRLINDFNYVSLSSKNGNDYGAAVIDNSVIPPVDLKGIRNHYIIAVGGIGQNIEKGYINFYGVSSIEDARYSLIKTISSDRDISFNTLSATDILLSESDFFVYTGYRYSLSSVMLMVGDFASELRKRIIAYEEPGEKINSFNFSKDQETYVLFNKSINLYDVLGFYKETIPLEFTQSEDISAYNIGFTNYGRNSEMFLMGVDKNNKNYTYNYSKKLLTTVDETYNKEYNTEANLFKKPYSITQDWMTQGYFDTVYPLPGYNIKLRLNNKLNYEDSLILNYKVLGETLNSGTYHFALVLDTLKGVFRVYLNNRQVYEKLFDKAKYYFVPVLSKDIIFGNTPFYGGTTYENYYKSKQKTFFVDDLIVEKVKFFDTPFTKDEIGLLYYEKFSPSELIVDIDSLGYRNYIDSISRVFRHKKPGHKTNLINITINDSTITDITLRDYYESLILAELKRYLPIHVKINSIRWLNNKKNDEIIPEGYFDSFISISTT